MYLNPSSTASPRDVFAFQRLKLACSLEACRPIRPPIRQPLALHAEKGCLGALAIVHTQRDAVVVAELELGHVAVQVLLVAVLVDALHPALEDREVALDRGGVDRGR